MKNRESAGQQASGTWVVFVPGTEPVFVASHHWVGIDFDGTLSRNDHATHCGPPYPLGEPIPQMVELAKNLIQSGVTVRIFSARACDPQNVPPIQDWTEKHGLGRLEVTNQKDYNLIRFYDDRAIPMNKEQLRRTKSMKFMKAELRVAVEVRNKIAANLFPSAHAAIQDWDTFPWHRSNGHFHTSNQKSSQALAISVFGTIKILNQDMRDAVMNAIISELGMGADVNWQIELEWKDEQNLLNEDRATQVDVKAQALDSMVLFECKFTESSGPCSQVNPLSSGPNKGLPQCNGNYVVQQNPSDGRRGRCALAVKGIRYWEVIPKVFKFDSRSEYLPCPFKDHWYQLMRNVVLCHELGCVYKKRVGFAVVFADSPRFEFSKLVGGGRWKIFADKVLPGVAIAAISYQQIIDLGLAALNRHKAERQVWGALKSWVEGKIQHVEASFAKI